jgi:hypothetical protein
MPIARVSAPAGVALRSQPSTTAPRVALLPSGTSLSLMATVSGGPYDGPGGEPRSDWWQVDTGVMQGFVAAGWLKISTATGGEESPPLREFRGVWIASHAHSAVWQSREALARALDQLVELGWNTIFPAVWNQSFTAWPSAVMERLGLPRQDPVYAQSGLDPLQLAVDLGKERGLTVIPWLEYGFAAEPVGAARPLLAARPEWAARDRRGQVVEHGGLRWLNALEPDVQDFLGALVMEVVERYGVDGVCKGMTTSPCPSPAAMTLPPWPATGKPQAKALQPGMTTPAGATSAALVSTNGCGRWENGFTGCVPPSCGASPPARCRRDRAS